VTCNDQGFNACGSGSTLSNAPGSSCACGEGAYTCSGTNAVTCTMAIDDNAYTRAINIGSSFDDSDNWIAATR